MCPDDRNGFQVVGWITVILLLGLATSALASWWSNINWDAIDQHQREMEE